jgi:hypothetical protein
MTYEFFKGTEALEIRGILICSAIKVTLGEGNVGPILATPFLRVVDSMI